MTRTNQPMPSASIVTPHKVQARLLNRALGLAPPSNGSIYPTAEQQSQTQTTALKPARENQQPSAPSTRPGSSSKARVFRCLSNTNNNNGMCHSPPASSSSSLRAHQQAQQRSALKSMFQPPASSPNRHMKPRQQPQERIPASHSTPVSIYLGCRLDRSTVSSRPLRKAIGTEDDLVHRRVHFQPCVTVLKIPSHKDYPSQTKKTLWGSMKEIKANAIRNTAEFIYDKCNWRKSTEENQFYRDTRNGSLIHPVHVQRYYAALEKMKQQKKLQQQQAEEKKQQQQQSENQEQEPQEQEEEERSSSRKRVRCCTPSLIRSRSHLYESEHEHQVAKRARRSVVRVPHPVYYSAAPYGCSRCQQENNYSYEYCRCYQQQMHRSSYHHSSHYYQHRSYPATTEIA